jgi:hypothetical protein
MVSGEARYPTKALNFLAARPTVPAEFGSEERGRLRLAVRLAGHDPQPFAAELARDAVGRRIQDAWNDRTVEHTA